MVNHFVYCPLTSEPELAESVRLEVALQTLAAVRNAVQAALRLVLQVVAAALTVLLKSAHAVLMPTRRVLAVVLEYAPANSVARVEYAACTEDACLATAASIAVSRAATAAPTQEIFVAVAEAAVAATVAVVCARAEPAINDNTKIIPENIKVFLNIFYL